MKVSGKNLIGFPSGYYLLFLGNIPKVKMYFAMTIPEINWCNYQLGQAPLAGIEIAVGESEQILKIIPVNQFSIDSPRGNFWELRTDDGGITLRKIGEIIYFGEDARIPLEIMHDAFKEKY